MLPRLLLPSALSGIAPLVAFVACSRPGSPRATEAGIPDARTITAGDAARDAGADAGDQGATDPRFPSHVAALAWEVKIHEQPALQSPMLGYLRAGAVVAATAEPVSRSSCSGGWYGIAPRGFVCVETHVATTDVHDPIAVALSRRPNASANLPYMYGLVRQHSAIYSRLPTRLEAAHAEYKLGPHMRHWLASKGDAGPAFRPEYWMDGSAMAPPDATALWDARATQEVPAWLTGGKSPPGNLSGLIIGRRLVIGHTMEHQGFAFIGTAVSEGRRYAITTDLVVVPVDRLRPIVGSEYHGVRIPTDIDVPFALIRRDGAWSYELRGDRMVRRSRIPRRASIALTGKEQVVGSRRYDETKDGRWLSQAYASRVDRIVLKPITQWAADGEHW
ncbi:MAG: hypothetical protein ACREJ3_20040, partial [Polyangiaceae bacterium]